MFLRYKCWFKEEHCIRNEGFVQGDSQYNIKMVLKKYLNLENTSRLEWIDLV
jgi:hypothetical protein